jgi:nucleotide-binding universal stress UspA family protein
MVKETVSPVVVGVDGSGQSERAVRFALTEARRRGSGILLVHAMHQTAPMTGVLPPPGTEPFTEVGHRLVDNAERMALEMDPAIEVRKEVRIGGRVGILVDAGAHASAIVLGHRSRSLAGRVLTSSTTTGVAARAHCPVISVPESWTEGSVVGRVVVGVDGSDASHDALDLGFLEARRRGARLVVLHAWRLPVVYEGVGYTATTVEDWMAPAAEEMDRTLTPFRETYPDVTVEVDLQHELAGPALLKATEDADLVVVGRRGHGAPWGVYLGSLARMLVREGRCPVEVAPQHPRDVPPVEERLLGTPEELSPET